MQKLVLFVALALQGVALAAVAFGGNPALLEAEIDVGGARQLRARQLDAVIDAAFITCQPYSDACDADPACTASAATCAAFTTDKVMLLADQSCAYNLGVAQKVRICRFACKRHHLKIDQTDAHTNILFTCCCHL